MHNNNIIGSTICMMWLLSLPAKTACRNKVVVSFTNEVVGSWKRAILAVVLEAVVVAKIQNC
jgi:hypothetical protein